MQLFIESISQSGLLRVSGWPIVLALNEESSPAQYQPRWQKPFSRSRPVFPERSKHERGWSFRESYFSLTRLVTFLRAILLALHLGAMSVVETKILGLRYKIAFTADGSKLTAAAICLAVRSGFAVR